MKTSLFLFFLFFHHILSAQTFEGIIKYHFKINTENQNTKRVFEQIQSPEFEMLYKNDKCKESVPTNQPYYLENQQQDYMVNPSNNSILKTDWQGELPENPTQLFRTEKDSIILGQKCILYQDKNKNEYWIAENLKVNVKGAKNLVFRDKGLVLYQKLRLQNTIFEFQAYEIISQNLENNIFELPKNYKVEKMKPPKINNIFPTQ